MALLAMEQYGLMLCDLARKFASAETLERIRELAEAGLVPVWMPSRSLEGRTDVPSGWDSTSDTLAAWLAAELKAESLTLVKSAPPPAGALDAADLAARGYVDAAFAAHVAGRPFAVRVCGPDDHAAFRQALAAGRLPGVAVGAARARGARRQPRR
jgi:dihydroneopterin aldolase